MMLSKNFKLGEFEYSASANAAGLSNKATASARAAIQALVTNVLQPICDATGWSDIISSGYRSPAVNKLVGGVATSQHVKGEASDNKFFEKIGGVARYISPYDVAATVRALGLDYDQMILYPTFVHLSYTTTRKNRRQLLYNSSYKGRRL